MAGFGTGPLNGHSAAVSGAALVTALDPQEIPQRAHTFTSLICTTG
jgi:hypothetical protein